MSIEQRLEQVERQTKRLRIAVVVLAAALCGVVSMAATEGEGSFEVIFAKRIYVQNDKGEAVIRLTSTDSGAGLITTRSATYKPSVMLYSNENGGEISVFNKTGEDIVTIGADDYGNGEVGAWNRKGKGRILDSQ